MLECIFWLILGAFVGWNFPQPELARKLQLKTMAMFQRENKHD